MVSTAGGRGIGLKMASGLTIFVPARLACLTTWVILEQERGYEREVDFLVRWLRPGMTAVDMVGGDFGVYALPIARAVRAEGKVLALEPDKTAAALLEESKAFNRLEQLNVVRSAEALETALQSLERLDFLRIGEAGAGLIATLTASLERWSPLVMFQIRPGPSPDLETASALQARGFDLYRALGDASMLVPWRTHEHERWDVNLIAARPELAARLEQLGLLAQDAREPDLTGIAADLTRNLIGRLPHLKDFGSPAPPMAGDPYLTGLAAYEAWLDPARPAAERYGALCLSLRILRQVCALRPSPGRLSSLARVALEAGARQVALRALKDQGKFQKPPSGEPFLAVSPRFDRMRPLGDTAEWFTAQVLEQGEILGAYTSHGRKSHAENLGWLCADSFAGPEMLRRLVLQNVRDGSTHTQALQALLDARPQLNAQALKVENLRKLVE